MPNAEQPHDAEDAVNATQGASLSSQEIVVTNESVPAIPVRFRWMMPEHMAEVLGIEEGSSTIPWSKEYFIRCSRQRNCVGMVSEYDERVVGFMIYELYEQYLHILNFAVHTDFRRRGVGMSMLHKLVKKLSYDRRSSILMEVRETNLHAQRFFKEGGFRATEVLRHFYDDTGEDGYLMKYQLEGADQEEVKGKKRVSKMGG